MSTRVEGNVELQYSIGADGGVRDIQVLHAQPEGVSMRRRRWRSASGGSSRLHA